MKIKEKRTMISKEAATYLILSIIFNQSCKSEIAFKAPSELLKRLKWKSFDLYKLEKIGQYGLFEMINIKPCLHRFPMNMAKYINNTVSIINGEYKSDPRNIWKEKSELEIINNLMSLSGIGRHKAIQCIIYLYVLGEVQQISEHYIKYMTVNCEMFFYNMEQNLQYIRKL